MARVTEDRWIACTAQDRDDDLQRGRGAKRTIAIEAAATDVAQWFQVEVPNSFDGDGVAFFSSLLAGLVSLLVATLAGLFIRQFDTPSP